MSQIRVYVFIGLVLATFFGLGITWTNTNNHALTLFTKEDGFLEWLTFLCFLSSSLFCFYTLYVRVSLKQWRIKSAKFWGLFLGGFIFFLGAGEEISWAQRLFDFSSPEFFVKNNNQSETNFHNLRVNGVKINKLIFGKLLFVCIFLHNVILPAIAIKKPKVSKWIESIGGFFPPWPLVFLYLGAASLVGLVEHERHKELLETSGAIHYFASIVLTYGLGVKYSQPLVTNEASKNFAATAFIVYLSFLTLVAWILSAALKL